LPIIDRRFSVFGLAFPFGFSPKHFFDRHK
jgi:hypothetical protein